MALASFILEVDVGVDVLASGVNGSTEQATPKICAESFPRGTPSDNPTDVALPILEFDSTCQWRAIHL